MTARRLEEFISLIETAEKISDRPVPSLKLSSLSTPTSLSTARTTGLAVSHCGLTLSDTSRPTATDTARDGSCKIV